MAQVIINPETKKDLSVYLNYSNEDKERLTEIISSSPIGLSPKELSKFISSEFSFKDIENVCYALFSICRGNEDADNLEVFLSGLQEALKEDGILLDDTSKMHLNKILNSESIINLTRKASRLSFDRQNILGLTRIITDIRPLFKDNDPNAIIGTLIIHNLKIAYHEYGEHKELFLAIDTKDMEELSQNIKRALAKDKAMREVYNSKPIIELK